HCVQEFADLTFDVRRRILARNATRLGASPTINSKTHAAVLERGSTASALPRVPERAGREPPWCERLPPPPHAPAPWPPANSSPARSPATSGAAAAPPPETGAAPPAAASRAPS